MKFGVLLWKRRVYILYIWESKESVSIYIYIYLSIFLCIDIHLYHFPRGCQWIGTIWPPNWKVQVYILNCCWEINKLIFELDKFYRTILDDFTLVLQVPYVFKHQEPNPKPLAKGIVVYCKGWFFGSSPNTSISSAVQRLWVWWKAINKHRGKFTLRDQRW